MPDFGSVRFIDLTGETSPVAVLPVLLIASSVIDASLVILTFNVDMMDPSDPALYESFIITDDGFNSYPVQVAEFGKNDNRKEYRLTNRPGNIRLPLSFSYNSGLIFSADGIPLESIRNFGIVII